MICGHEQQKNFLTNWFEQESRGSVILVGPEGVGKFSLVKEILKNFENYEKIIINTDDKILKIETARFLERISFKKTNSKRIVVVNDFHKLKEESQNVILKTLEEPLSPTLFVLVTHQPRKILPTIKSRSIILRFGFLDREITFKILKENNYSDLEIDLALKIYPYQPGKALDFLKNRHFIDYFKKFFQMTTLEKINSLRLKEPTLKEEKHYHFYLRFLEILILSYRQELIEKAKRSRSLTFKDFEKIKELLDLYSENEYDFNWNLQLISFLLNHG